MLAGNEILVSFFESKEAALRGLAIIEPSADSWGRRRAVVVSQDAAGSSEPFEPPAPSPPGALIGAIAGGIVGLVAGAGGVLVGLLFGVCLGLFVDLWRTLGPGDLLDEIQDGLEPGRAALVTFVRGSSGAPAERKLAGIGAVTLHRFPPAPIEEDLAREVREATAALGRLADARDSGEAGGMERERGLHATLRKLTTLEAVASELLWRERLEFEFERDVLNSDLRRSRHRRAGRMRRRLTTVRASHRRRRQTLEASRDRVRAATASVQSAAG